MADARPDIAGQVVLASASPRRQELLGALLESDRVSMHIQAPDIDEAAAVGALPPAEAVVAIAAAKLAEVRRQGVPVGTLAVVAADTVVISAAGDVLGKPVDIDDATAMMRELSESTVDILTGVAIWTPERAFTGAATTVVSLGPIDADDIAAYVRTDIPWDKAGALELQGASARFVTAVDGCWSNVIGLPVCLVAEQLEELLAAEAVTGCCQSWLGGRCPRR